MTLIFKNTAGFEVWANFDESGGVYELYSDASAAEYLGFADTLGEARKVAKEIAENDQ